MLRLAADENLNDDIVRGLLRRNPRIDIRRLREAGLQGADDVEVLEWCAQEDRVLLTHDVSTVTRHAYDRIRAGKRMPGVFEISSELPVGAVLEDLLVLGECSLEREWEGQVRYLPLR